MINEYPQSLKSIIPGKIFKTGGVFSSIEETTLEITGPLYNEGFIESEGPIHVKTDTFHNEMPSTEISEEVVVKKRGSTSVRSVKTDNIRQGGVIRGSEVFLQIKGKGTNVGGIIEAASGVQGLYIHASDFSHLPLYLRKAVQLKVNYSIRREIIPGRILSEGENLQMLIDNKFVNEGSEIISLGDPEKGEGNLNIVAGSVKSITVFDSHISTHKSTFSKTEISHTQIMSEPRICGIGSVHVQSTKEGVHLEGEFGSFCDEALIESEQGIHFNAVTRSVENEMQKNKITFNSITQTNIQSNSTITSRPFVFAGKSLNLHAKGPITGEGVQFDVVGKMNMLGSSIRFTHHGVEHHELIDGVSVEITCFGTNMVKSIQNGEPLHKTVESLLSEDSGIASIYGLLKDKKYGSQTLPKLVGIWNRTAKLAKAKNDGRLKADIGEHLGITNSEGEFDPNVTVRFGTFDQNSSQTQIYPSTFAVGGVLTSIATEDDQYFEGCQMNVVGGAQFLAPGMITFKSPPEQFTWDSSNLGMTFGFGPQGFSVGGDFSVQEYQRTIHRYGTHNFGESLTIIAGKKLLVEGDALVAKKVKVEADIVKIQTLTDNSSYSGTSGSLSTKGDFSFADSRSHSHQVNSIAGITALEDGHLKARELELIGGSIINIEVDAQKVLHENVSSSSSERSISFSGNVNTIADVASGNNQEAFAMPGAFGYKNSSQRGETRATIAGSNGHLYSGINTDLNARQIIGKEKKTEFFLPVIVPNFDKIKEDFQEMKKSVS
ncbi:MAG: hypothetical protein H0U49_11020, partial [Parachlamydiaceae bacterium]|nr:hypothetical protein [Parachlamydiaceae bacterium]